MGLCRQGFGEGLKEVAQKNDQIVGLCCDLTISTKMDIFKSAFPDR
ncbi:transketolase, partial [Candidatus Berkelbacteria bacterium CG_4_8_14_3_um_filter_33_6]